MSKKVVKPNKDKNIADMTDDELEEWASKYYRQTGKDKKFAYTITDKNFGDFKVLNSANAWWTDRAKVERLISAYKIDATNEEACSYSGISLKQLRYFRELHDDFGRIKAACREIPNLRARKTIVDNLSKDPNLSMKYLERKKRDEFGQNIDVTSNNKELSGLTVGFTDFDNDKDTDNPSGDEGK